jgi:hypothetical protein
MLINKGLLAAAAALTLAGGLSTIGASGVTS